MGKMEEKEQNIPEENVSEMTETLPQEGEDAPCASELPVSAESIATINADTLIPELQDRLAKAKADVPKRSIGSKIFLLIMAVLVVLGVVRVIQLQQQTTDDTAETILTNVQTQQVALGSIEITSPLAGRIQAKDSVDVVPLASGEVTAVNVKEGDHVAAGQVLFTIDNKQAQITYDQALINIQTLEDSLETLQTNYDRTKTLYEAGAVAKTDVESLENSMKSTKNQLETARLSAQSASNALAYYTVTAPSGGYVTAVNVTAGGPASSAAPAVSISDTSVLELSSSISEYMINSVRVGDKVDVYVESASGDAFKGTITTISEAPTQGTYTYPITVRVDDPKSLIKAGMFAEVRLIAARKVNVISIPSDAVVTSSGEKCVIILNDDSTVSVRKVAVGIDNGTMAEITEGLSKGENVVIKGQTYVEDGERVNVVG